MAQVKTVVPYVVNAVGVILILLWVGFIALLLMHGQYQFTGIMLGISLLAILIVAMNER
ncbi:hypothetical protein [Halorussus sp. AFM4]|uniref:hypothetical protein n=1 Tax=Halorussus sp. AFM4 TaxID=3421651 RepID=UPI003EBD561B